ncbi:hypothetical protein LCGC14_1511060, partial [marine sediment metagenome]
MKKTLFSVLLAGVLFWLAPLQLARAQATLTSTTLSAAVTDTSGRTLTVASATDFAVDSLLYVNHEAMVITAVSGTVISVTRGAAGTKASTHQSATTVYVGVQYYFSSTDRSGSCTSTNEVVLPVINVSNGNLYTCSDSQWALQKTFGTIEAPFGTHVKINTVAGNKNVRIQSRTYTYTGGGITGVQIKPGIGATTTHEIKGIEISPRFNDGFTAATIVGLHVDVFLKGTTAVTTSGDVRGMQIELVTDDAGTRTISGYVTGLRMRSAFSATAITGNFSAFRIEKPEAQTNSQTYDGLFDLTSTIPLVWNNTP